MNNPKNGHSFQEKGQILVEALSNIPHFVGETFVIKYGGIAMSNETLLESFANNIVLLKQLGINPIIVHEGEYKIDAVLKMLGMDNKFINNIRLTDKATINIIEMVLCGSINKKIVQYINTAGGSAIGLCGKDGNLIKAEKIATTLKENRLGNIEKILDMGFIGRPVEVNPDILFFLEESDFIPVIAPVGYGSHRETYHINAESIVGAIAIAVSASKMIIFSDSDKEMNKMSSRKISVKDLNILINNKEIKEEKLLETLILCTRAVEECSGVAHIVNGKIPNIILELFTENHSSISIVNDL